MILVWLFRSDTTHPMVECERQQKQLYYRAYADIMVKSPKTQMIASQSTTPPVYAVRVLEFGVYGGLGFGVFLVPLSECAMRGDPNVLCVATLPERSRRSHGGGGGGLAGAKCAGGAGRGIAAMSADITSTASGAEPASAAWCSALRPMSSARAGFAPAAD